MNKIEYLLTCLSEECGEIIQASSKCQRFGVFNVNPKTTTMNLKKLSDEINDLFGVLEVLKQEGIDFETYGFCDRDSIEAKKTKLRNYMEYSENIGTLYG